MQYPKKGYTFIELLSAISILVIVFGLAAPGIHSMVERNKAATGINWIIRAVSMTRGTAIERGVLTTLCPTKNRVKCGGKWHDQIMIFTDGNGNRKLDHEDVAVSFLKFPHKGSTLKWRAFKNQQYLQMTSTGFTNYQNGNFVYCSADRDLRFSRQIVLNLQGRLKQSHDRNNDGLVEDRYGKHLKC
jgi:type IV fimbrial biogenesis protein FimT